jgi:hypothetical protein
MEKLFKVVYFIQRKLFNVKQKKIFRKNTKQSTTNILVHMVSHCNVVFAPTDNKEKNGGKKKHGQTK